MSDYPHWDTFLNKLQGVIHQEGGDSSSSSDFIDVVVASCPCPQHGGDGIDTNPSLRAFLSDEGTIVLVCRAGCSTPAILKSMGLKFSDLYSPSKGHQGRSSQDDTSLRADVYECILNYLSLAPRHEKVLLQRGFTMDEIRLGSYRTLNKDQLPKLDAYLGATFHRDDLARVPGFDENGAFIQTELHCGLVVPVRRPVKAPSTSAQVPPRPYLLKVRRTLKPKYVLWSSSHLPAEPGFHWPIFNGPAKPLSSICITEGEFKADLAALRTGEITVSMPGIEHRKGLLDFLNGFAASLPTNGMTIAWDWADVLAKPAICRSLFLFLDYLSRHGHRPNVDTWDVSPVIGTSLTIKGLDDALVAGRPITRQDYSTARSTLMNMLGEGKSPDSINAPSSISFPLASFGVLPPFPLEVFPPELRPWVTQVAQLTNTPPDYVATSALVVAGRCLGTKVRVSILPGWVEQANLYAVIVAPPSSTKSPAVDKAMRPLKDLQAEAYDSYRQKKEAWDHLYLAAKASSKTSKAIAALPCQPPPPHDYWVDDITIESLVKNLQANQFSTGRQDMATLIYRDELSAWVNSLNQYRAKGQGADKEFFLSAWNGSDVKVDRKSQDAGLIYLRKPFVSVLGSTTPEVVSSLDSKDGQADGFFQRILCCMAAPKPAFRLAKVMPCFPCEKLWDVIVRRLLLWSQSVVLKPTQEAWDLLKQHYDKQADIIDAGLDQDLHAMAGKHRAYILRFSLIIHALNVALGHSATGKLAPYNGEQPSIRPVIDFGQLEAQDVAGAIKLVDYFQAHYVAVRRHMQLGPEDRKIAEFVAWANLQGGRIEPSDVYSTVLFGCRGKLDAIKLFRAAEDRGRGIVEEISGDSVFFSR